MFHSLPPIVALLILLIAAGWCGLWLALWMRRSGEHAFDALLLHAVVAGTAFLGVSLESGWVLGSNVHRMLPLTLAGATLLAAGMLAWNVSSPPPGDAAPLRRPGSGTAGMLLVLAVLLTPYAVNGGRPYYGRAWGDQINYSLVANVFRTGRKAAPAAEQRTAARKAAIAGGFTADRIGQSLLHAWATELTGAPLLESFYLVEILGWIACFGAAFLLCCTLGVGARLGAALAVAVAIAPPLITVGLESFLSQVMVTPIVVYGLVVLYRAVDGGDAVWLVLCGVIAAWTVDAYFEFLPLLLGATLVLLIVAGWQSPRAWGRLAGAVAALGIGVTLAFLANPMAVQRIRRVRASDAFEAFFPWAYTREGAARLLVGDAVASLWPSGLGVIAILVVLLSAAGVAGYLLRAAPTRRPLAWATVSLVLLPPAVRLLPGEHSYQFYKLLQSFWPFTLCGLGLLARSRETSESSRAGIPLWLPAVAMGALFGTMSARMLATEARGQSPRSGMNVYLRRYGQNAVQALLEGRPEKHLVISYPNRPAYNDRLANGITTLQVDRLFAYVQSTYVFAGDSVDSGHLPDPAITGAADVHLIEPEFLAHHDDLLVLQVGAPFLQPSPERFEIVRRSGRLQLLKPRGSDWLIASSLYAPLDGDFMAADNGATVGDDPAMYIRLDLESSVERPEGVGLELRGRTLDDGATPESWHVYSNAAFGTYAPVYNGVALVPTGPLRRGVTQVYLGPRFASTPSSPGLHRVRVDSIVYGRPFSQ